MFYNTTTEKVPTNIIAGMFHFKAEEFFELEDQAQREAPKVKFS
jgi:LemA protein